MENTNTSSRTGIGPMFLLGTVFVVLKLTHVIDWKWVWITLPFWGGLAFVIIIMLIPLLAYFIIHIFKRK